MNGEYSKVNFPELRRICKEYKNNKILYCDKVTKIIETSKHLYDENVRQAYFFYTYPQYKDLCKTGLKNYYIENEKLSDFLETSEIKMSYSDLLETTKKSFNGNYRSNQKNVFWSWIHSKTYVRSLLFFVIIREPRAHLIFCDGIHGASFNISDISNFNSRLELSELNFIPKSDLPQYEFEILINKYKTLILNLLFYMSAFPDHVLDGPPNEVFNKKKGDQKTITISKEIADYLHENRDVSPHLRRGHFRYLGSDHYTKKRGQTIFVKSSFVKGTAKTIIENQSVSMA